MYEVSVDETFAAGHALRDYYGKCENVHGHNFKVRVTLEGPALDDGTGLLYDFVHLKQIIQNVIRPLDHQHLNDVAPFRHCKPFGRKHRPLHLRRNLETNAAHRARGRIGLRYGVGDGRQCRDVSSIGVLRLCR